MRGKRGLLLGVLTTLGSLAGCGGGGDAPTAADTAALDHITALRARLADLEREAQRLESVGAIKRLQRAYGFYLDEGLWDDVADLFSDDATIEYANEGVYAGEQRIREYLHRLGGGRNGLAEGQLNEHMQLQPVITLAPDGNRAQGRWRTVIMSGEFGKSANWGEGTYENEYVNDGGTWKIRKLHWYVTFVAPYELGWTKVEPVDRLAAPFTAEFPPDAPPTEDYKPFPGVYFPPFHWAPTMADDLLRQVPADER